MLPMAIVFELIFSIAFAHPHSQSLGMADPDFLKADALETADSHSMNLNPGLASSSQSDITQNPFQSVGNPSILAADDLQSISSDIIEDSKAPPQYISLNSDDFLRSDSLSNPPDPTNIIDESDSLDNPNRSVDSLISAAPFTEIEQNSCSASQPSASKSVTLAMNNPKACPANTGNPIPGGSQRQQRLQKINQRKQMNAETDENFDCSKMDFIGNQPHPDDQPNRSGLSLLMGRNPKYRFCCTQGPARHNKSPKPGMRASRYQRKNPIRQPLEEKSTIRRKCIVCGFNRFFSTLVTTKEM